jgi:hypothetical protein
MRSTSKGKTKRRSLGTCRFDLAKCAISSSGSEASGVALALELVAPTGGEKKYGVVPPGVIRLVVSSEFVEGGDGDTTLQSDDGTYSDSDSLAAYPEDFISKDEDSRPSSLANATAEVSSVEPEDVDSIQAEIDKLQREIEAFESPAKISAADQPADASIPPRVEDSKRRTRAALLGGLRSGALEAAVASLPPDDPPAAAAAATAAARGSGSGSGSDRAPRGWQTASHETATGSNAPSRPANAARSPRDGADSSAPTRSPSAAGVPSTARKTRAALLGGLRSGALEKAVATLPENGEGGSNSGARAAAVAAATARPARVATAVDDGELGLGSLSRADAVPTGESQVARELAAAQRELADMKAAMQSLRSLLGPGRGGGSPRDDDAVRDQLLGATQQLCECRVELSQAHERQADLEAELREAKLLLAQVPPPPFFFFFFGNCAGSQVRVSAAAAAAAAETTPVAIVCGAGVLWMGSAAWCPQAALHTVVWCVPGLPGWWLHCSRRWSGWSSRPSNSGRSESGSCSSWCVCTYSQPSGTPATWLAQLTAGGSYE